ncbi:MAG: UPF0175 family protein [Caldilineaceae bacterium]|nr:UPF0175 family protein [Caldilineaceae bacterium]MCB0143491.1 UPF0175 family protein [Caldilineaceae bacterium]
MTILTADTSTEDSKADWLLVFEAALRIGEFASFDEILLRALNVWLEQLPADLRWKIAIELYSNDRISTGRAAEIAGLNYVIFIEKLRDYGIAFMAAEMTDDAEREREEALLDELLSI